MRLCIKLPGNPRANPSSHSSSPVFTHLNNDLQDTQNKFGCWVRFSSKSIFDHNNTPGPACLSFNSVQRVKFNFSHIMWCACASNCLATLIQWQTPALTILRAFLHIFNNGLQDFQNKFGRWVHFGGTWSQESQSQPWGHDHEQQALQIKFICH